MIDLVELIERLESHMGKQDISVLLKDCRAAATVLRAQADEIERLRRERDNALKRVNELDCCMCGSRMDDHDLYAGHSPVSMYDYHFNQVQERAEAAEAQVSLLREALEFYATAGDDGDWEYGEWVTKLTQDGGSRARDTLRRAAALAQPKEGLADAAQ